MENLQEISDRALLKMIYEHQAYLNDLQNKFKQAQEALNKLNIEGQRRVREVKEEEPIIK